MSAKSSNKSVNHYAGGVAHAIFGRAPESGWQWPMLVLLPLWVLVAFVASSLVVSAMLFIASWLSFPFDNYVRPSVLQTFLAVIVYALTLGIVIAGPYLWTKRPIVSLQTLGLARLPSWTDIGLAPITYFVYAIASVSLLAAVISWFPGLPLDQAQDVGFQAMGSRIDNLLAFLTLVVLSPLAEETLFRGYLYGKLKAYVPAVLAALVTSLLFALVHFQLNVGIDVFVLSLLLCGLRSLTGSIWAGVLVHIIKNGVAYYIVFVSPFIGA